MKDEDRDTRATAKEIVSNRTYNGTLTGFTDVDYYKFTPQETGRYRVIVRKVTGGYTPMRAAFLRSNGTEVVSKALMEGNGEAMNTLRSLTRGRTYYIEVGRMAEEYKLSDYNQYRVRITK